MFCSSSYLSENVRAALSKAISAFDVGIELNFLVIMKKRRETILTSVKFILSGTKPNVYPIEYGSDGKKINKPYYAMEPYTS